jgi:hypothetical protein
VVSLIERGGGYVVRMEDTRNVYKILVGKPEGKKHFGDLAVYEKINLKWINDMDWRNLVQNRE